MTRRQGVPPWVWRPSRADSVSPAACRCAGNSHLVTVPAGGLVLADFLISSPVFMGDDGANPFGAGAGVGAGGGDGGFDFGASSPPPLAPLPPGAGPPARPPSLLTIVAAVQLPEQAWTRTWTRSWPWPSGCRWRRSGPGRQRWQQGHPRTPRPPLARTPRPPRQAGASPDERDSPRMYLLDQLCRAAFHPSPGRA